MSILFSLTTNGAISHLFDVRSEQYTRSFLVHHARYSLCTSPTISKPDALGLMFVEEIQQDSSKKSSKLAFNPCSIPKGNRRLTTRFFFFDFFFLDFFFLDFSVEVVLDVADAGAGGAGGAGGGTGAGGAGGGAGATKGEGTPTATEGGAIVSNAAADAAATKAAFLRRRSSRSETGGLPNRLPLRVVILFWVVVFQSKEK